MHSLIKDIYKSLFPSNDYFPEVEYLVSGGGGSSRIILTSPHGGGIRPRNIPHRKKGKVLKDSYTRRIIQRLSRTIHPTPYYLYSDLHRSRLDLNRDIEEATEGNKKAEEIWKAWNHILSNMIKDCIRRYGRGIYIDLHSHNDSNEFHLGYGISAKEYLALQEGQEIRHESTLNYLRENDKDMMFGYGSIKDSLERFGYKVFTPNFDDVYFSGGRNIRQFSTRGLGAIQIEIPVSAARENLNKVVSALSYAIPTFSETFVESRKVPR